MNPRPDLGHLGLSTGKKARLHGVLHEHGLRNGTALFLPYDQGLEHGPRDFSANPAAGDPVLKDPPTGDLRHCRDRRPGRTMQAEQQGSWPTGVDIMITGEDPWRRGAQALPWLPAAVS